MKSVMVSIRPKWCELIASGEKTIEVRKTAPKEVPFKAYIYCTKPKATYETLAVIRESFRKINYDLSAVCANVSKAEDNSIGNGKVIGEFICNDIYDFRADDDYAYGIYDIDDDLVLRTCLENGKLWDYGKGKPLYGWNISDLVIYDKPKELKEFIVPTDGTKDCCDYFDSKGNNHCRKCPYFDAGDSSADIEDDCCGVYYFDTTMYHPLFRPPQSWMYVEVAE